MRGHCRPVAPSYQNVADRGAVMAMEVDADQLEALAALPEVTDIQEDRQAWASLAQSVPLIQADYCYDATYGKWACDHGTHVAGIAIGRGGNQTFAGVAKGGNLIPMQVFTWDADYRDSFAYFSDISRGY